jgi:hypothetical protein
MRFNVLEIDFMLEISICKDFLIFMPMGSFGYVESAELVETQGNCVIDRVVADDVISGLLLLLLCMRLEALHVLEVR